MKEDIKNKGKKLTGKYSILFFTLYFLPFIFCLLFLVSVSSGADDHQIHHAVEFKPVAELFRIINFLVVFGTLYFLLAKYIRIFFADRREGIIKAIDGARQLKVSTEKNLSDWKLKIKDMENIIAQIIKDARREGEFIKGSIIRSANEASRKILERAEKEIEYETKKAGDDLRKYTAEITVKMAEDILKEKVTRDDHTVLVKEYLNKV